MTALIGVVLITLAAVFQAGFLLRRENRRDPLSHWMLALAAVLLLAVLADRSIRIRFVAVTDTYESLVFYSAAICVVLFVLRMARRTRAMSPFVLFGATIVSLALILIALFAPNVAPPDVAPPVPALRSFWLVLHVTFSFIGEAFFVVSFVAAIGFLASRNKDRRAELDRLVAASISIGYPVFTAGALVFGAIWAQTAWGAWWSWDPKETWALITWLIYTAYLHSRLVRKLRGTISAVLAIAGFAATVFTFFGVNYLLSGLHSYG
ncbi:MAG: cytochrome c biogenesis protein CcsA [Spirochaetia bacterium]|jgi:ABC-type transport system involved in cytochrome c biogenesis permease subunit